MKHLSPAEVLDEQVQLTEKLKNPSVRLTTYFDGFMQSVLRDAQKVAGKKGREAAETYLFYPARTGSQLSVLLGRQLSFARTYQVTGKMVDAVTATYHKAMEHVGHMEEQEVPAEAGFCWFDKPLDFLDVNGKAVRSRALSWAPGDLKFSGGDVWRGVRLTSWCHTDDPDDFWDLEAMADLKSVGFNGLTLGHSVVVPFGQRFLRRQDLPPVHVGASLMEQLAGTAGRYSYPVSDDIARWSHTLFMFLDMEVTVSQRPPIERHARKRAARSLNHAEVNVVTLRRAARQPEGEPGHHQVDWSCRWPVQGFWRHNRNDYAIAHHHVVPDPSRKYCAAPGCGNAISWVRPCLRGPEYLPLKQGKQVFRLVR